MKEGHYNMMTDRMKDNLFTKFKGNKQREHQQGHGCRQ